jgi:hypothetical protein
LKYIYHLILYINIVNFTANFQIELLNLIVPRLLSIQILLSSRYRPPTSTYVKQDTNYQAAIKYSDRSPHFIRNNFLFFDLICMSQDTTFNPRSNVNLRRIELTLISRLNQLELHLECLTEAQEQLIYTTDYLQQTSAPFLVLSYIGFTERYLDRQRTEITAATNTILDAIRILQELRLDSR